MESFGFGFDLGVAGSDTSGLSSSLASLLLGSETQGLSLDFTDMSALVRDTGTPANNFAGSPATLLTYTAPSAKFITNSSGLLVSGSTIRTDYTAAGVALGVLIEEARTNNVTYSQDFDNAAWEKGLSGVVTVTANAALAPDGTMTADLAIPNASNGYHNVRNGTTFSPGTTSMYSVYAKAAGYSRVGLREDYAVGTNAVFLLSGAGSVITGTGTIEALANGWYRCMMPGNASAGQGLGIYIMADGHTPGDPPPSYSFTGDGTSGCYIWGAQGEVGAEASSYIPTPAGSTVTRAADVITLATTAYPHSATVNSAMVRYRPKGVARAMVALRWDDGTANEVVSVGHSAAAALGLTVTDGGAGQTAPLTSGTATVDTWEKIACSWKANDFLFSDNGGAAAADTGGTLPTVTSLDIGPTLTGHISQILVVPVEKTAAEVATMATT